MAYDLVSFDELQYNECDEENSPKSSPDDGFDAENGFDADGFEVESGFEPDGFIDVEVERSPAKSTGFPPEDDDDCFPPEEEDEVRDARVDEEAVRTTALLLVASLLDGAAARIDAEKALLAFVQWLEFCVRASAAPKRPEAAAPKPAAAAAKPPALAAPKQPAPAAPKQPAAAEPMPPAAQPAARSALPPRAPLPAAPRARTAAAVDVVEYDEAQYDDDDDDEQFDDEEPQYEEEEEPQYEDEGKAEYDEGEVQYDEGEAQYDAGDAGDDASGRSSTRDDETQERAARAEEEEQIIRCVTLMGALRVASRLVSARRGAVTASFLAWRTNAAAETWIDRHKVAAETWIQRHEAAAAAAAETWIERHEAAAAAATASPLRQNKQLAADAADAKELAAAVTAAAAEHLERLSDANRRLKKRLKRVHAAAAPLLYRALRRYGARTLLDRAWQLLRAAARYAPNRHDPIRAAARSLEGSPLISAAFEHYALGVKRGSKLELALPLERIGAFARDFGISPRFASYALVMRLASLEADRAGQQRPAPPSDKRPPAALTRRQFANVVARVALHSSTNPQDDLDDLIKVMDASPGRAKLGLRGAPK
ncbi:hypothetical protein M885DRAFT_504195 [Pelagophyceae sp. CCMP2097]|nr:hypothetical protein M885DRAFT_504195 [Pelagophyceae sp. CCMP2097]